MHELFFQIQIHACHDPFSSPALWIVMSLFIQLCDALGIVHFFQFACSEASLSFGNQRHFSDNSTWKLFWRSFLKLCFTAVPKKLSSRICCSVIFAAGTQCLYGLQWKRKLNIELASTTGAQCKIDEIDLAPKISSSTITAWSFKSDLPACTARISSLWLSGWDLVASFSVIPNSIRPSGFWGFEPKCKQILFWQLCGGSHFEYPQDKPES